MSYCHILKPQNIYYEEKVRHGFGENVVIFKSRDSYRFCHIDKEGVNLPYDSCLTVDRDGYILSVYTKPKVRRMKLAKQLLLIAKLTLGKVRHSDNITKSGRLWRDSVEGLNKR